MGCHQFCLIQEKASCSRNYRRCEHTWNQRCDDIDNGDDQSSDGSGSHAVDNLRQRAEDAGAR